MSNKDGMVEAKKGGELGSSIPPFSSRFVETQRQSVKVVKAKSVSLQGMRARTRGNSPFIFFIRSESLVLDRVVAPS